MEFGQSRASRNAQRRAVFVAPPFVVAMMQQQACLEQQRAYAYQNALHHFHTHYPAPHPAREASEPAGESAPRDTPEFKLPPVETMEAVMGYGGYSDIASLYQDKTRIPFFDIVPRGR